MQTTDPDILPVLLRFSGNRDELGTVEYLCRLHCVCFNTATLLASRTHTPGLASFIAPMVLCLCCFSFACLRSRTSVPKVSISYKVGVCCGHSHNCVTHAGMGAGLVCAHLQLKGVRCITADYRYSQTLGGCCTSSQTCKPTYMEQLDDVCTCTGAAWFPMVVVFFPNACRWSLRRGPCKLQHAHAHCSDTAPSLCSTVSTGTHCPGVRGHQLRCAVSHLYGRPLCRRASLCSVRVRSKWFQHTDPGPTPRSEPQAQASGQAKRQRAGAS